MDASLIKEIIPQLFDQMAAGKAETYGKIQRIIHEVMGGENDQRVGLVGLKEGHLMITVDSSATLFMVNLKKNKLLERLKKEVSEIKQISFKIGKMK